MIRKLLEDPGSLSYFWVPEQFAAMNSELRTSISRRDSPSHTRSLSVCLHLLLPHHPFPMQLHSNSDKGDGSVRYILDGEGAGTIFIIDEVTGDIHATKSLDREKKGHYVLHAQALDRHTEEALEPKSEFIIKVQDINDNAPKFPDGPFVAAVPEMSEVGESRLPKKKKNNREKLQMFADSSR